MHNELHIQWWSPKIAVAVFPVRNGSVGSLEQVYFSLLSRSSVCGAWQCVLFYSQHLNFACADCILKGLQFSHLKLLFGISILSSLLRNKELRTFDPPPFLPKRYSRETCFRKKIKGCCFSLIWIKCVNKRGVTPSAPCPCHYVHLFLNYLYLTHSHF